MIVLDGRSFHTLAFGQENSNSNNNNKDDIVLLSHSYNRDSLIADAVTGEILNNGTGIIKAVEMTAIFYNDGDDVIGNERSGTNPFAIKPGDRAVFTIQIIDEVIKNAISNYDFTAKWKDEYLANNYFVTFTGDEISDSNSEDDEEDEF